MLGKNRGISHKMTLKGMVTPFTFIVQTQKMGTAEMKKRMELISSVTLRNRCVLSNSSGLFLFAKMALERKAWITNKPPRSKA
jgi:hypothetical protein